MVVAVVFSGPTFIAAFRIAGDSLPIYHEFCFEGLLPQINGYGDEDIFEYGDEQQAEQLLQI